MISKFRKNWKHLNSHDKTKILNPILSLRQVLIYIVS